MQLLSWGKRLLAYLTQAAPQEIALAETSEDSLFATIAWLASDEGGYGTGAEFSVNGGLHMG